MAVAQVNRQWLLARRPVGAVRPDDFKYHEAPIPKPADGEVLVRTLYFAYDASQRIWLTDEGGYMQPVQVGEAMRAMGIGQVVESRDPAYQKGDLVEGFMSWQDFVLARSDGPMPLRVLPKADYPLTWNMSVLGVSGLTAYFGVADVLKSGTWRYRSDFRRHRRDRLAGRRHCEGDGRQAGHRHRRWSREMPLDRGEGRL